VPEGHDISFGQMPKEQKNRISHRARALEKLVKDLL
jgi:XTP/dITP diphosphohydrolase